jgi:hypothetical protein
MRSRVPFTTFGLLICLLFSAGSTFAADEGQPPEPPVRMKLLLLSTTGWEPSAQSMTYMLDRLGAQYEHVKLVERNLPPLEAGGVGLYQGIILSTGNLPVCDPDCRSALDWQDWVRLEKYMEDYGVRLLSCYSWPEPRYGLVYTTGKYYEKSNPARVHFTHAAADVFPNLRRMLPLKVQDAYAFKAAPIEGPNEETVPILTLDDDVVGVLHTKHSETPGKKKEYLALTFDSNWFLLHSQILHYGLVNWVTKGVFLGERKAYLTPQSDDLFLPNDLFDKDKAECRPVGFAASPTFDPTPYCESWRMDGSDLDEIYSWQQRKRSSRQFADFQVSFAFNGWGTTPEAGIRRNDSLTRAARRHANNFTWINHTFDHESLDCYNPDLYGNTCRPATYSESNWEISYNAKIGSYLGLSMDEKSMVTPAISGLNNREFLRAAVNNRVRYLVGDLSRPEGRPAQPNTGIVSNHEPQLLYIPRHATAIFYNVTTPYANNVGSITDEYNFFYGPNGYFQLPGGQPFFNSNQSYEQIVERESDALLGYMFKYEMYPVMFHQSNHYRYAGGNSIFTDVLDSTMAKFGLLANIPVISTKQSELGEMLKERKAYLDSGVEAIFYPAERKIELTVRQEATIPMTGVCVAGSCETYAGERHSFVLAKPGETTVIRPY